MSRGEQDHERSCSLPDPPPVITMILPAIGKLRDIGNALQYLLRLEGCRSRMIFVDENVTVAPLYGLVGSLGPFLEARSCGNRSTGAQQYTVSVPASPPQGWRALEVPWSTPLSILSQSHKDLKTFNFSSTLLTRNGLKGRTNQQNYLGEHRLRPVAYVQYDRVTSSSKRSKALGFYTR